MLVKLKVISVRAGYHDDKNDGQVVFFSFRLGRRSQDSRGSDRGRAVKQKEKVQYRDIGGVNKPG